MEISKLEMTFQTLNEMRGFRFQNTAFHLEIQFKNRELQNISSLKSGLFYQVFAFHKILSEWRKNADRNFSFYGDSSLSQGHVRKTANRIRINFSLSLSSAAAVYADT